MWFVMMAAIMLPALVPALMQYRASLRGCETASLNLPTALAGAGYSLIWAILGAMLYPIGVGVANAEMPSLALARSVPLLTGAILLLAAGFQFTAWKARQLCRCRDWRVAHMVSLPTPTTHGVTVSAWVQTAFRAASVS